MRQRNNLGIVALDAASLGSLFVGYYYDIPSALTVGTSILWVFSLMGIITMFTILLSPKSIGAMIFRLQAAEKLWSMLDQQSKVERLYDEATDVAYVLLLWIAGAQVVAVVYGVVTMLKGYNRTQGARQRVLRQAGEVNEP